MLCCAMVPAAWAIDSDDDGVGRSGRQLHARRRIPISGTRTATVTATPAIADLNNDLIGQLRRSRDHEGRHVHAQCRRRLRWEQPRDLRRPRRDEDGASSRPGTERSSRKRRRPTRRTCSRSSSRSATSATRARATAGHNIGINYEDAFLPADNFAECAELLVGQCTIIVIQEGRMPPGSICTGDPAQDAGNPDCLTQEEQDTVQAWIDAGMPE
jgi:hypothetical protein